MYKAVTIIYLVCFFCYVLFSRVPDYFEGDFIKGVVAKATFSEKDKHPELVIDYRVGAETFHYKTAEWFLTNYKPGQAVEVIYNPSDPSIASIYAFIGYWIKWPELLFTAMFFIILFLSAVFITGKNSTAPLMEDERRNKRKYDD